MKSKTSFFNMTIFKKNIKRVWPFWGLLSFIAVIPSLFILLEWTKGEIKPGEVNPLDVKDLYFNASAFIAPFVAFSTAIIAAVIVWEYLYRAKSVGAFHSYPITRTGLFVTNYLSGLAIMLIPYAIGGGFFILTLLIIGAGFSTATFTLIAAVLLNSVFFFSFATVIAMMTGHILALPVLYMVFNFLALAIENMFSFLISGLLYGFSFEMSANTGFLSPIYYLLSHVSVTRDYSKSFEPTYHAHKLIDVRIENFGIVAVYGAVGVALGVIALIMYQRKRSESAGDVISAKPLKPIILCIYTITGTTLLGMLLYYIFTEGNFDKMAVVLGSLCFTAALAISYYSGLMILEKTVKVFNKKSTRGFLAGVVIVILGCLALRYDVLGLEKRIPDASQIEEMTIYAGNKYTIYGDQPELLDKAIAFHKLLIDNKEEILARMNDDSEGNYSHNYVNIGYKLKNGEKISREYSIILEKDGKSEFDRNYVGFVTDKEIVRTLLHVSDGYDIVSATWYLSLNDNFLLSQVGMDAAMGDFETKEAKIIYDAAIKDLEVGNWIPGFARYTKDADVNVGNIYINYEQKVPRGKDSYYYNIDEVYIMLTGKMTNTLNAMADCLGVDRATFKELILEIEKRETPVEEYYVD